MGAGLPLRVQSLDIGYPRNDAFFAVDGRGRAAIRAASASPRPDAVLYAPTLRDYRTDFSPQLDLARSPGARRPSSSCCCGPTTPTSGAARPRRELRAGALIDVSGHRSVEELCLAADALITDYSSIMFDYANLDRPSSCYADDWEIYRQTRGVYFDLLAAPPGPVAPPRTS